MHVNDVILWNDLLALQFSILIEPARPFQIAPANDADGRVVVSHERAVVKCLRPYVLLDEDGIAYLRHARR
jgi:hypothetical protein